MSISYNPVSTGSTAGYSAQTPANVNVMLAAEYLIARIGEEAAQQVVVYPVVWSDGVMNRETMTGHFRFLDSLSNATSQTEGSALSTVAWSPEGVTVSAGLYGFSIPVSKVYDAISPANIGMIASQGGSALGRTIDSSLTALFPSLTAGTAGTTATALTWDNVNLAESYLDTYFAIGKRYGFIHPHQYANLKASIAGKNYGVGFTTVDAQGNESITIGSTVLRKQANVSKINSNADYCGAIITEQALGCIVAQNPTVEILPIPGSHAYSVDCTVAFGSGIIRPRFGAILQSGVSA